MKSRSWYQPRSVSDYIVWAELGTDSFFLSHYVTFIYYLRIMERSGGRDLLYSAKRSFAFRKIEYNGRV